MNYLYSRIIGILAIILILGCNSQYNSYEYDIPDHIGSLENLTVIPKNVEPTHTVGLTREMVFESSDQIFINLINYYDIDDFGRVYIAQNPPAELALYVFQPDGQFLGSLSREGSGPGEFRRISDVLIQGDSLYVYDNSLKRVSVFSIETLSFHRTIVLSEEGKQSESIFQGLREVSLKSVRNDGALLMRSVRALSLTTSDDSRTSEYFYRGSDGNVIPEITLSLKDPYYFTSNKEPGPGHTLPFTTAFTRRSLISATESGFIYTAWSEDFLIKQYDSYGNYLQSFYYPIEKSVLEQSEFISGVAGQEARRILRNEELPETWPALHALVTDDEDRIWIATITDSDSHFKWWVLNSDGDVIARFTHPGKRSTNSGEFDPSIIIKNDFFYTVERNPTTGEQRVVRYRIEIMDS